MRKIFNKNFSRINNTYQYKTNQILHVAILKTRIRMDRSRPIENEKEKDSEEKTNKFF